MARSHSHDVKIGPPHRPKRRARKLTNPITPQLLSLLGLPVLHVPAPRS